MNMFNKLVDANNEPDYRLFIRVLTNTVMPPLGCVREVPWAETNDQQYQRHMHTYEIRQSALIGMSDPLADIYADLCRQTMSYVCSALGPVLGFPITETDLELARDSQDDRIRTLCESTELMYHMKTALHPMDPMKATQSLDVLLAVRVFVHKGEKE
jgi:hypothetical protein